MRIGQGTGGVRCGPYGWPELRRTDRCGRDYFRDLPGGVELHELLVDEGLLQLPILPTTPTSRSLCKRCIPLSGTTAGGFSLI
jgi:hypothetical protein